MSAPQEIEWSLLSGAGREAVGQIVFRLSAGYTLREIAETA